MSRSTAVSHAPDQSPPSATIAGGIALRMLFSGHDAPFGLHVAVSSELDGSCEASARIERKLLDGSDPTATSHARWKDIGGESELTIRFDGLRSSLHRIVVFLDDARSPVVEVAHVRVDANEARLDPIDLRASIHVVSARVLDGEGDPCVGAVVLAHGAGRGGGFVPTTDEHGDVSFAALPGPSDLTVAAAGYPPTDFHDVRDGSQLMLHHGIRVRIDVAGLPPVLESKRVWVRLVAPRAGDGRDFAQSCPRNDSGCMELGAYGLGPNIGKLDDEGGAWIIVTEPGAHEVQFGFVEPLAWGCSRAPHIDHDRFVFTELRQQQPQQVQVGANDEGRVLAVQFAASDLKRCTFPWPLNRQLPAAH